MTRWHRLLGEQVKFLTGTDEHGLKIQQAADAAGLSPQEFADGIAPRFAAAWESLEIANDDFIRTTEPRHRTAVLELLQRCYDAGDIELDHYRGKYCVRCEAYYTDDELLPGDLCPIHKLPVDEFEEENYFFRLSRYGDRLLDWYAAHPGAIVPEFRGNEALGLIRSGLRDFSISRTSVDWGIPLPWDPKHVAYVWFDALTNYLSAVGFGRDDEEFDGVVAGRRPAHRQGHHPLPLRVLAGDAAVRRASSRRVGSPSAAGCSSTARRCRRPPATSSSRSTSSTPSASTGCATTCSPTRRTATTAISPAKA